MKNFQQWRVISSLLITILFSSTHIQADIKIGAPFALSGSIAELAEDMKGGAVLAARHINEQGGVLGQNYQLLFEDSACNPDQAVDVVTRLIQEKNVSAIIGPVCSGATLRQAQSVSIPAGVVTLSVASASFLISGLRDNDLVFRVALSSAFKGKIMAEYILAQGITDIALSFASDGYNTGIAKVFAEAFIAGGGKLTVNQAHQPNKPDYKREAAALVAGSKNLVVFAYYNSSGTQLLKDAFATGEVKQVFGPDGMLAQELIDALGSEALQSTRLLNDSVDETREAFKIWETYAQEAEIPARGPFVANSYDAAFMMALAIEAAGTADRSAISAGLRAISGPDGEVIYPGEFTKAKTMLAAGKKINYQGGSGIVDFDEHGDVPGVLSVNRVKEGKWQAQLLRQE